MTTYSGIINSSQSTADKYNEVLSDAQFQVKGGAYALQLTHAAAVLDVAGNISLDGVGDDVMAVYFTSAGNLVFSNADESVVIASTMTEAGPDSGNNYAVYGNSLVFGEVGSSVSIWAETNLTVTDRIIGETYGIYSEPNGDGITFSGDFAGTVSAIVRANGSLSADASCKVRAYGIYGASLTLVGAFTGNLTAVAEGVDFIFYKNRNYTSGIRVDGDFIAQSTMGGSIAASTYSAGDKGAGYGAPEITRAEAYGINVYGALSVAGEFSTEITVSAEAEAARGESASSDAEAIGVIVRESGVFTGDFSADIQVTANAAKAVATSAHSSSQATAIGIIAGNVDSQVVIEQGKDLRFKSEFTGSINVYALTDAADNTSTQAYGIHAGHGIYMAEAYSGNISAMALFIGNELTGDFYRWVWARGISAEYLETADFGGFITAQALANQNISLFADARGIDVAQGDIIITGVFSSDIAVDAQSAGTANAYGIRVMNMTSRKAMQGTISITAFGNAIACGIDAASLATADFGTDISVDVSGGSLRAYGIQSKRTLIDGNFDSTIQITASAETGRFAGISGIDLEVTGAMRGGIVVSAVRDLTGTGTSVYGYGIYVENELIFGGVFETSIIVDVIGDASDGMFDATGIDSGLSIDCNGEYIGDITVISTRSAAGISSKLMSFAGFSGSINATAVSENSASAEGVHGRNLSFSDSFSGVINVTAVSTGSGATAAGIWLKNILSFEKGFAGEINVTAVGGSEAEASGVYAHILYAAEALAGNVMVAATYSAIGMEVRTIYASEAEDSLLISGNLIANGVEYAKGIWAGECNITVSGAVFAGNYQINSNSSSAEVNAVSDDLRNIFSSVESIDSFADELIAASGGDDFYSFYIGDLYYSSDYIPEGSTLSFVSGARIFGSIEMTTGVNSINISGDARIYGMISSTGGELAVNFELADAWQETAIISGTENINGMFTADSVEFAVDITGAVSGRYVLVNAYGLESLAGTCFTITCGLETVDLEVGARASIGGISVELQLSSDTLALSIGAHENRTNLLDNGYSQIVAWDAALGKVGYIATDGQSAPAWMGVWEWSTDEAAMWKVVGVGRFSADVEHDGILLYNGSGNTFAAWTDLNDPSYGYVSLCHVDGNFQTLALADFDNNGLDDVIIYDENGSFGIVSDAQVYHDVWHVETPETNVQKVIGAGYFGNADGKSDILVRNTATGVYYLWHNEDPTFEGWNWSQAEVGVLDDGWEIAAIGDFQGDGVDDIIIWQKSTGYMFAWENGNSSDVRWVGALDASEWEVAAVGDYDGDGKEDLLLRELSSGWGGVGYWGAGSADNWTDLNARIETDMESKFAVIA